MYEVCYCEVCGGAGMGCPFCDHGLVEEEKHKKVPCVVAGYLVEAVPGKKFTLGQGGNCWGPIPLDEVSEGMDTEGVFEAEPIRPCNCGSGVHWAFCPANSPYCG